MRKITLTLIHLDVDGAPPDLILRGILVDNTLVLRTATGLLAREVDQSAAARDNSTLISDGVLVELGDGGVSLDLDATHVEAGLGEVLQIATNNYTDVDMSVD